MKLLEIVKERRSEKCHAFPKKVESLDQLSDTEINNHLLLFTSALVPKALSSILTSVVIALAQPEQVPVQGEVRPVEFWHLKQVDMILLFLVIFYLEICWKVCYN